MITRIDKAIIAFILAAGGSLGTAQVASQDDLTTKLVTAGIVGLVAAFGVWLVPNKTA